MFGFFGNNKFESEMAPLEKMHKTFGAQILKASGEFDLERQMSLMESWLNLYDDRIECCKKHGKVDLARSLESERESLRRLRG
jgi:hypothetical protein